MSKTPTLSKDPSRLERCSSSWMSNAHALTAAMSNVMNRHRARQTQREPEGEQQVGKRLSGFERREADFYPTLRAAVAPLIPHLRGVRTFAEPCCDDGDLVRHLEVFGLRCAYAGDIRDGHDALALDDYGVIDAIITNTP